MITRDEIASIFKDRPIKEICDYHYTAENCDASYGSHLDDEDPTVCRSEKDIAAYTDWLDKQLPQHPASVIDLGCGKGFYSHCLSERGHQCLGIDISQKLIDFAAQHYANDHCRFECQDILQTNLPNNQDAVFLLYSVFHHFKQDAMLELLSNIYKSLKPQGVFFLETLGIELLQNGGNKWGVGNHPRHGKEGHLYLKQTNWDAVEKLLSIGIFIVHKHKKQIDHFVNKAYLHTDQELIALLKSAGFRQVTCYEDPPGTNRALDYFKTFKAEK